MHKLSIHRYFMPSQYAHATASVNVLGRVSSMIFCTRSAKFFRKSRGIVRKSGP